MLTVLVIECVISDNLLTISVLPLPNLKNGNIVSISKGVLNIKFDQTYKTLSGMA